MRVAYLILAAAASVMVAASGPSTNWKQRALASAAPFIDQANHDWARAIRTGNTGVMSAPYAKNGIFIGTDGTVFRGRDAVRTMYTRRPAGVKVLKASIESDGRVAADPDDVYEWGTAKLTIRQGKKVRGTSGRYLTVWHREGKRWLITRNIAF